MNDYEYIKKYSCYRQMDKEDLYVWLDNLRQENQQLQQKVNQLEQIAMKKAFYIDANDLAKEVSISFEKIDDIVISINDLIKNQKKIIEKLNKNNSTQ